MKRDELVARHVEALVGLGWRWEGRGLIPCWLPSELFLDSNYADDAIPETDDD